MAHGCYGKRRVAARRPPSRRLKGFGLAKQRKAFSLKCQIRSLHRLIRQRNLPNEVREEQLRKLEKLKEQQEFQRRLAFECKISQRDRRIKFFERRKIERRIRRLERFQRISPGHLSATQISNQLSKLKEDLEYVRFFPKTEIYVSLFLGGNDPELVEKRNKLRKQIRTNIVAAAANGRELEETGSEDDFLSDMMEDDFFSSGSDEAEADDEWTDRSTREQASSTSGKNASGMSSDEKNQRHVAARTLMPPPRASTSSFTQASSGKNMLSDSSFNKQSTVCVPCPNKKSLHPSECASVDTQTGYSSNLCSSPDVHTSQRKRCSKKKPQI